MSAWWQRFELGQRVRFFSERAGEWRDGEVRRIERWRCSNGEDRCSIEVARVVMGSVERAWGSCFDESNREYLRTLSHDTELVKTENDIAHLSDEICDILGQMQQRTEAVTRRANELREKWKRTS